MTQVIGDPTNQLNVIASELICNPDEQTLVSVVREVNSINKGNQDITLKKKGRRGIEDYYALRSNFDEIDKIPSTSSLF